MKKFFLSSSEQHQAFIIALIVFITVMVVFLPVVLVGISLVVNQGETQYTMKEVDRSRIIFQNELTQLDQIILDWSNWDDTYQFAQDKNQAYIDTNLTETGISSLGINIFMAVNNSGEIIFAKEVDLSSKQEVPVKINLSDLLKNYPTILNNIDLQTGKTGIAIVNGTPMLLASRPILNNKGEGPSHGTLVFLRLLDATELNAISNLTQRRIDVYSSGHIPIGTSDLPAASILKNQVFVTTLNTKIILGYEYLDDLNGQPLIVLRVENPRDLYSQGMTTALVFSGALGMLGLILFIGVYYFSLSYLKSRKSSRKYLERFKAVVHQSVEAILIVDPDWVILEANPAFFRLLGLDSNTLTQRNLKNLLQFEPDLDKNSLEEAKKNGVISEHHCVCLDGSTLDLELSAVQISSDESQSISIIIHDVTHRRKSENALRISEERYMLAAQGANDGLWDWNLMSNEIYFSARWKTMLGYSQNEIGGSPDEWFDRVHPDDIIHLRTQLSEHLHSRSEHFECEYRILHRDGQYYWMLVRGVAVWDAAGYAHRIAGSQTDITERKIIENQLRYDALHDGLTGLGNRTLLIDHLIHANERKKRKPDMLYAIFFLDFDKFKKVNDSFGHHAGDQVLIEASHRLENGLRATDTITRFIGTETLVRIAGDEFVLLLEDFDSVEDIYKTADRIVNLLSSPYHIDDMEVILTASLGLVIPQEIFTNPDDLIRNADIAMYRAKQQGGGQIVAFDDNMFEGALTRMQMESDLRQAVDKGEFEVYYQPIYSLGNDHLAGFEALVRWHHPMQGLVMPMEFIPLAEETGLIVPIGYFVLEDACRKMQSWRQKLLIPTELVVSVNLTSRQIFNPALVPNVASILKLTGFDPKRLWLEVSEISLIENNKSNWNNLEELRKMGIRIEIDDFGTGYSSLSYLQHLPVDGFKIDRSFVNDLQGSGKQIIKTLIDLGHNLGLVQVAEGIETENQKAFLKNLSCEYAQGFLMSKPITASAIEEMIKSSNLVKDTIKS